MHSWYHAIRTRDEADDYLAIQPSGSFLVRVSGNKNGYSLSAKYVLTQHHTTIQIIMQAAQLREPLYD